MSKNTSELRMFAYLPVALFFALTLSTSYVFAQENIVRTSPASFSLSAVKEEKLAPRRVAFSCPSPTPLQAVPPEPFQNRANSQPSRAGASTPLYRPAANPSASESSRPTFMPPSREQFPKPGRTAEKTGLSSEDYAVNWSPWMASLANRWFGNLQAAEEASGLRFHTARPALIQFTCYADGQIGNVVLKQSSGIPYYDRLQVATLMASAPLPPFPSGTERRSLTLVQGWESHKRQPGEREFEPTAFAARFPQEKVSRWVTSQQ